MKKTDINLIPDITNPSPDYYCTWQTQLYASCDGKPVGICLWWIDTADLPFSNKPGWGTILEMGLTPDNRGKGWGRELAEYALTRMDVSDFYVCAYGPAEGFWKKCGYEDRGELASNGLKLLVQRKVI